MLLNWTTQPAGINAARDGTIVVAKGVTAYILLQAIYLPVTPSCPSTAAPPGSILYLTFTSYYGKTDGFQAMWDLCTDINNKLGWPLIMATVAVSLPLMTANDMTGPFCSAGSATSFVYIRYPLMKL